jgi:hypothetical protein
VSGAFLRIFAAILICFNPGSQSDVFVPHPVAPAACLNLLFHFALIIMLRIHNPKQLQ